MSDCSANAWHVPAEREPGVLYMHGHPGTDYAAVQAIEVDGQRFERVRECHVVKNSRKYVLSNGAELFDDGCSICNGYVGEGENYCSNCGARVIKE